MHLWNSFRFRIFVLLFLVGLLPLYGGSELIKRSYKEAVVNQKIDELRYTCSLVAGELSGSTLSDALTDNITSEFRWIANYSGGRLLLVDSSYRIIFDTYGVSQNKFCISEEIIETFQNNVYETYLDSTEYVELAIPLSTARELDEADDTINGVLVLSASASWVAEVIRTIDRQIFLVEFAGTIILAGLSFILAWTSSIPWRRLVTTLSQIGEGDLDVTFKSEGGYNETKEITETFNSVVSRLYTLDQSRQEFVSNVSHELKTPITSMRVLADSILAEENIPADIYREFMEDISGEIDRETKIINDLLSLVRMDRSTSDVNIESVSINNLVELILKRVRPIAKERSIEIVFESFRPVTADVDETKLSLAITNLVENAVKYNNDGGWVHVSLDADHKFFYLRVEDSGVGIPEDAYDKIFERFYRVDKARSRETGGTGLGLAITKNVIKLHHGGIRLESKLGEGTKFVMRIPLKYIA